MEVSSQLHAQAALPLGKEPLDRRLGEPQSRSGSYHKQKWASDHRNEGNHRPDCGSNNAMELYSGGSRTTGRLRSSWHSSVPPTRQTEYVVSMWPDAVSFEILNSSLLISYPTGPSPVA
jgi:hypothetical protein